MYSPHSLTRPTRASNGGDDVLPIKRGNWRGGLSQKRSSGEQEIMPTEGEESGCASQFTLRRGIP